MRVFLRGFVLLLAATALSPLHAHELLSASLQVDEVAPGDVRAILKVPLARDGRPVALVPQLQPDCETRGSPRAEREGDVILRQWRLQCAGGLAGRGLQLHGLDPRMPDAVVVARFADGASLTQAIDRHDPVVMLNPVVATAPALLAYLPIGIEHILLGPDHLLFVLGLMLVVYVAGRGWRMLVAALTAFTLAHSLTLALAVLGIWGLPPKAVEVLIALSIVLLAWELARHRALRAPPGLALRKPWLVAFAFGLLHGFGFAGALAEVGLPAEARGWALLLFNVGVEIGQLVFVTLILLLLAMSRAWRRSPLPATSLALPVTALGGIAMYWTFERVLSWSAALASGI